MADNIGSLFAEAQIIIDDMLQNEISTWAQEILRQRIVKDIYEAYTPKPNGWVSPQWGTFTYYGGRDWRRATYPRRYSLLQHITGYPVAPGEILVTSTARISPPIRGSKVYPQHDGDLLQLIEGERHGLWAGGFPRPAVGIAQYHINKGLPQMINRLLPKYFS